LKSKIDREAKENANPHINKASQNYARKFEKEGEGLVDRLMMQGKRIE
jgi:hypothetical protein